MPGATGSCARPRISGALTVIVEDGHEVLVGLSQTGLGRSDDGGRTWQPLTPPEGQLVSLAAAEDGSPVCRHHRGVAAFD